MYPIPNTEAKKMYPYLALFSSFIARRPNKEGVLLKEHSDGYATGVALTTSSLGHWGKTVYSRGVIDTHAIDVDKSEKDRKRAPSFQLWPTLINLLSNFY